MTDIVLTISGMTCGGCVNSVTRVLQSTPGVRQVSVTLVPSQAVISYDESVATPEQFAHAISEAGFTVMATRSSQA